MRGDFNLPPGCTSKNVDAAAGEYQECLNCGKQVRSDKLTNGICGQCTGDEDWEEED